MAMATGELGSSLKPPCKGIQSIHEGGALIAQSPPYGPSLPAITLELMLHMGILEGHMHSNHSTISQLPVTLGLKETLISKMSPWGKSVTFGILEMYYLCFTLYSFKPYRMSTAAIVPPTPPHIVNK
jgi:hypothetical protein